MKLKMFALNDNPPTILPAERSREWMDEFPDRHAYRCLPLAIANTYGWEVLSPYSFTIDWNGGTRAEDITFRPEGKAPLFDHFATSNFTHGIVTFHTGYLFRTEPDYHLLAGGPLNTPKDGISPLTGIIESDWLPYPFTMNWQLTRPGSVRFEAGEPFCHIIPVHAMMLEKVEPEILSLRDDPDLQTQYAAWRQRREEFMTKFRANDKLTLKQAWQKYYFKGLYPDGEKTQAPHTQKLKLPEPVDRRTRK